MPPGVKITQLSSEPRISTYFVRGAFSQEIVLRHGKGYYTVVIAGLDALSAHLNGEGFIESYGFLYDDSRSYTVKNNYSASAASDWEILAGPTTPKTAK